MFIAQYNKIIELNTWESKASFLRPRENIGTQLMRRFLPILSSGRIGRNLEVCQCCIRSRRYFPSYKRSNQCPRWSIALIQCLRGHVWAYEAERTSRSLGEPRLCGIYPRLDKWRQIVRLALSTHSLFSRRSPVTAWFSGRKNGEVADGRQRRKGPLNVHLRPRVAIFTRGIRG